MHAFRIYEHKSCLSNVDEIDTCGKKTMCARENLRFLPNNGISPASIFFDRISSSFHLKSISISFQTFLINIFFIREMINEKMNWIESSEECFSHSKNVMNKIDSSLMLKNMFHMWSTSNIINLDDKSDLRMDLHLQL